MNVLKIKIVLYITIICALAVPAVFFSDRFFYDTGTCSGNDSITYIIWPWGFYGFGTGFFRCDLLWYAGSCGTIVHITDARLLASSLSVAAIVAALALTSCAIAIKALKTESPAGPVIASIGTLLIVAGAALLAASIAIASLPIPSPAGAVYLVMGILLTVESRG